MAPKKPTAAVAAQSNQDQQTDASNDLRASYIERANAGDPTITLIPTHKVDGNHTVEPVLVDGEPVQDGEYTVVKAK